MAQAWREVINPAAPAQRYVLWDNGRIDPIGGALPITGTPTQFNTVPPANTPGPIRALVVTDWSGPSGYVMDWNGTVTGFGTVTAPASQAAGVPFGFPIAIDLAMNPTANGQGYILDVGAAVHEFGGATALTQPPALNINTGQEAWRFHFETFGGRFYVMTTWGAIYEMNGAGAITTVDNAALNSLGQTLGTRGAFWPSWSIAKEVEFYDFVNGKGWMLDGWGGIHNLNGAEVVFGQGIANVNYWPQWDIARDLSIIDNGTGAGPLTTLTLDGLGFDHQIIASTAPTAVVTAPTGTVTTTTRPRISWTYSDAEFDAQQSYHVKVFSSAQYGIGGFNPASSPNTYEVTQNSQTVFYHDPVFDFANGTWRAYVQVTDTSGLSSAWVNSQWIEGVTPPPTPTVTPTPGATALDGISVLVHATSPPGGTLFGLQYQDDASDPWRWVRGRVAGVTSDGSALIPNGSGNATIVDDEVSFGVVRTYRAISYTGSGTNLIVSAFSNPATAVQADTTKWILSNPADYSQGGVIHVQPNTFKLARPIVGSAFQPVGRQNAIVMTDGGPKGAIGDLKLTAPLLADYDMIADMIEAGTPLLLRDPYGRGFYIMPVYDSGGHLRGATGGTAAWSSELVLAPPDCGEVALSGAGFLNHISFPIVQVDRPLSGPATGPLALLA